MADTSTKVVDRLITVLGEDAFSAAVETRRGVPRRAHPRGAPRSTWSRFAQALPRRRSLRFELCLGVSGVHYPSYADRELHGGLPADVDHAQPRIRVEVAAPDADPMCRRCIGLPHTDWHERETYDFFGIVFDGHHR